MVGAIVGRPQIAGFENVVAIGHPSQDREHLRGLRTLRFERAFVDIQNDPRWPLLRIPRVRVTVTSKSDLAPREAETPLCSSERS